jgi:hypothetical protein
MELDSDINDKRSNVIKDKRSFKKALLDPPTILRTSQSLWNFFFSFTLVASINHTLFYVVLAFASSLLPGNLGNIMLGIMYISNTVCNR